MKQETGREQAAVHAEAIRRTPRVHRATTARGEATSWARMASDGREGGRKQHESEEEEELGHPAYRRIPMGRSRCAAGPVGGRACVGVGRCSTRVEWTGGGKVDGWSCPNQTHQIVFFLVTLWLCGLEVVSPGKKKCISPTVIQGRYTHQIVSV